MSEPPVEHALMPLGASGRRSHVQHPLVTDIYQPVPVGAKPLRLGILLKGLVQPRWVAWLLDEIAVSDAAQIVCVIQYDPAASAPVREKVATPGTRFGYILYSRIDAALARRRLIEPDPADLIGLSSWMAGATIVQARSIRGANGCMLADSAIADLRHEALDIILNPGSDRWTGEILSIARFGVWFYCWGEQQAAGGDADLFWAISEARAMTSCSLSMHKASTKAPRLVGRLDVPVHPRSLHLTRRRVCAAAATLTLRSLRRLQGDETEPTWGPDHLISESATAGHGVPTNLQVLRLLPKLALRWLGFRWQYRRGEWWFLALRRRPFAFLAEGGESGRMQGFVPLPTARGHCYADPFLLQQDDAVHLFFEDLDQAGGNGVISHCILDADGTPSPPSPVLTRPYHLSYPFVFRWEGQIYMVPETGHNRTIELYRSRAFPHDWILEKVLLQGWRATDATLHQADDGSWWMFATIDEFGEGSSALFLFQASTPLGPWRAHPQNPVQSDLRHTRPAGRLFQREGRLFRPAQDGSVRYGGGLWLMEVLELTDTIYRERPLLRLDPDWLEGNLCLHHLDATDQCEVIDGMRLRPAADPSLARP